MTTYLCDLPHYAVEYDEILLKISQANTPSEFEICDGLIERFYQKYGKKVVGFWRFLWEVENKPVHSCYEKLKFALDLKREGV